MNISINKILAHDTYKIRQNVLWPNKPISHIKVDGDEFAIHLGAFSEEQIIGVVSLYCHDNNYQFRKLAVLEKFQGCGVGRLLVKECIAIATQHCASKIWCDSRQDAVNFYKKLGFEIDSIAFIKSDLIYQKAFLYINL